MPAPSPSSSRPPRPLIDWVVTVIAFGAGLGTAWSLEPGYHPSEPASLLEAAAEVEPKPPISEGVLDTERRRRLYAALAAAEASARAEAEERLPIHRLRPTSTELIAKVEEEWTRLVVEARAAARRRLAAEYGLDPVDLPRVVSEGLREGWSRRPDLPELEPEPAELAAPASVPAGSAR